MSSGIDRLYDGLDEGVGARPPLSGDCIEGIVRFLNIADIVAVAEGFEIDGDFMSADFEGLTKSAAADKVLAIVIFLARAQNECTKCDSTLPVCGYNDTPVYKGMLDREKLEKLMGDAEPIECSVCEQPECSKHDIYGCCDACYEQKVCSRECADKIYCIARIGAGPLQVLRHTPLPPIGVCFYHEGTGCMHASVCRDCAKNPKPVDVWQGYLDSAQSQLDGMRQNLQFYAADKQPAQLRYISERTSRVALYTAAVVRARAAVPVPPPGIRGECPLCAQDFGAIP